MLHCRLTLATNPRSALADLPTGSVFSERRFEDRKTTIAHEIVIRPLRVDSVSSQNQEAAVHRKYKPKAAYRQGRRVERSGKFLGADRRLGVGMNPKNFALHYAHGIVERSLPTPPPRNGLSPLICGLIFWATTPSGKPRSHPRIFIVTGSIPR